jgi:O-antigen ligase
MRRASLRRASDGARPTSAGRTDRKGAGAAEERRRGSRIDEAAFALFVGYLVLAFTTAFPEQFGLPKLLGLYLYVAFGAVRWILAVPRGRLRPLPRGLALAAAATAAWAIAATLAAQHVPTALFGMRGRYNGLAALLAGLAVLLFLATRRTGEGEVERGLRAICAALTLASIYALVQAAGLDPIPWPPGRPASTIGHPVIFAGALAMTIPFALVFALDARSRRARTAWGGAAVLQTLALVLTLARGPWLAALGGLLAFALLAGYARRPLAARAAFLAMIAALLVSAVLALSAPTRVAVFERAATVASLSDDSSFLYRVHFWKAALAMLRDHPWLGVGWENYGLLYPRYRSSPTPTIAPDLVPTMVHSGPLQLAVSGGLPALALQILLLGAVAMLVMRRWRVETDDRPKLLGAAFLASGIAYVVQDLSGWPHVALGALAFSIWGLGVSWSLERFEPHRLFAARRWPLAMLAWAIGLGAAWMALDTWLRIRADRLMFEARQLDVASSWSAVEQKVQGALELSPDRAWANDAAAQLCLERVRTAADRRAYERGVQFADAASAANPFDPYVRLRRAELDVAAIERGLLARVTDAGRDALAGAKTMTVQSTRVRMQERALSRNADDSKILVIQPQAEAGFGPAGSLIVTGQAPRALPGSRVFLHWRNLTRKTPWIVAANASVPDARGEWYNAIPDARLDEVYEVYATAETRSFPCAYTGNGSINLCAPLAFVGPDTSGVGPPGSVIVAGSVPDARAGGQLDLRWRNATRASAWTRQPFFSEKGVSFPADAPGNWYAILPHSNAAEKYEVSVGSEKAHSQVCTYGGDGSRRLCAPIAWIQPQGMAGFGPPGSLVVAGFAPEVREGTPVFLHWRNATRHSEWISEPYAALPDANGSWFNAIPNANLADRYEVYVTSPTAASAPCRYDGHGAAVGCP